MQTPEAGPSTNDTGAADRRATDAAAPLAAEIVAGALGRSVRGVTPLVGWGSVNLILFVETDGPEVVVRMNHPDDTAWKVRGDYEKERWCLARAAAAGIPGPETLAVGEHAGHAYMIQNRVPGVNGKASDLPGTDLMRVLGGYARRIHALPVEGFGDTVARFETGPAQAGWLGFVDYNLGELTDTDPLIGLGVYAPDRQAAIRDLFQWLRGLPLRVGLNHGDLARRNTLVGDDGTVYLLDWGCAEMHVAPHYDLIALLGWYGPDHPNLHAFLDGYGIAEARWATLLPELRAFALLKSFDLTRWAIDRRPALTADIADRARACLADAGLA